MPSRVSLSYYLLANRSSTSELTVFPAVEGDGDGFLTMMIRRVIQGSSSKSAHPRSSITFSMRLSAFAIFWPS